MEMGIVSRKQLKAAGIDQTVYYADLNWTVLMKLIRKNKVQFSEIGKYPAVSRDLALLVDKSVEFAQIEQIAKATEKKLLRSVELFDVYAGIGIPAGMKSMAYTFTLRSDDHTLTDEEIHAAMDAIIENLASHGAMLRR